MKIQSNPVIVQNDLKGISGGEAKLNKGQVFSGKIISIEGDIYNIRTNSGANIRAYGNTKIELPLNMQLAFEVLDNSGDTIVIRPVQANAAMTASGAGMLVGLLESLGIEPLPENISFLKDGKFTLGKNVERILTAMLQEGREGEAQALKDIMVKPEELMDYIKGFDGGEKFLKLIEGLIKGMADDGTNSKMYGNLSANLLKGLTVQINHDFSMFFIPVPMYYDDKPYHGEIWIENNNPEDKEGKGIIYVHLLMDTPTFGRVEADIKSLGMEMNLNIYCKKEIVPLFQKYEGELKSRIRGLGINMMGLEVHEISKARNFLDFAQKYVKPFTPVDVRV